MSSLESEHDLMQTRVTRLDSLRIPQSGTDCLVVIYSPMQSNLGRIHFAHSDMSGISLFEEAYIRGQRAADEALNQTT